MSPIIAFANYLARLTDGKKAISGFCLVIGGVASYIFLPESQKEAVATISTGLTLLVVGLVHKAQKYVGK